ncbi:MAG: hypothetical protein JWP17_4115, partial [Solirubrobacterales bacterium]|nr:hypothetical protein [Solirubrobacterales bacterium]
MHTALRVDAGLAVSGFLIVVFFVGA